jgi:hypothetical protein
MTVALRLLRRVRRPLKVPSVFIVGDETEWWLGSDGYEFMNTLADNLLSRVRGCWKRNAWKPGVGSVAEATWDSWIEQEEKTFSTRETKSGSRILYDARVAPPETDMADRESLMRALEFVYEDCEWKTQEIRAHDPHLASRRARTIRSAST